MTAKEPDEGLRKVGTGLSTVRRLPADSVETLQIGRDVTLLQSECTSVDSSLMWAQAHGRVHEEASAPTWCPLVSHFRGRL